MSSLTTQGRLGDKKHLRFRCLRTPADQSLAKTMNDTDFDELVGGVNEVIENLEGKQTLRKTVIAKRLKN